MIESIALLVVDTLQSQRALSRAGAHVCAYTSGRRGYRGTMGVLLVTTGLFKKGWGTITYYFNLSKISLINSAELRSFSLTSI